MRIAICLALALSAEAADAQGAPPARAPEPAKGEPAAGVAPAGEQPGDPRARTLAVAQAIPGRATPGQVEQLTAGLGSPRISYSWCNRAGCVDGVGEARATRMFAYWSLKDKEAGATYDLSVMFCGGFQKWATEAVTLKRWPSGKGALGTLPKSETLHDRTESGSSGRCWAK